MLTMKVKPKAEIVRQPEQSMRPLPHGEVTEVPRNSYWTRRVRAGDVERVLDDEPKARRSKKRDTEEDNREPIETEEG